MTSEIDEFRTSLVAAVQAELERHASAVVAEVDRLRAEVARDRDAVRHELTEQLRSLGQLVEQVQARNESQLEQVQARHESQLEQTRTRLEQRMTESDGRQTRRLDDLSAGIPGLVQSAAHPLMQEMKVDQEALVYKVDGLDTNLRKFDEQAARMVTYFNDVTQQMELRQEELGEALKGELTSRVDAIQKVVDDNDSAIRRFQNEVGQSTSQKINDAEDRFNNRLLAAESRMKEEAGQKIAEIDAHVGRVSSNLDETIVIINDRIAAIDTRFESTEQRIEAVAESVKGVDQHALDELKEKMSTAVGEAMLVRIEMERLEKNVNERTDTLSIRMTEVETQVQDATMDVSTAVQLDRLEEIERALAELNPDQFVRKPELGPDKTVKIPEPYADEFSDGATPSVQQFAEPDVNRLMGS
jgi:uncharacterized protein YicC (UPF0701 family)